MGIMFLLPYAITLLAWLSLCANGQLYVSVYNVSSNEFLADKLQYVDYTLFSNRYSNVADLEGFLHIPTPNNACSFIQPLPDSINGFWFALVSEYPQCPKEMVKNVRAAGYKLLIAYSSNDSNSTLSVSQEVRKSGFPVVVIPEWYALDLKENATSDSFQDPWIGVEVKTSLAFSLSVTVFSFGLFLSCCILTICGYCYCRRRRTIRQRRREFEEYRNRQRNFEQIQRGSRNARQELIESILRQLQELQVDARNQVPLGMAETKQLPIRPYLPDESQIERCAICVEDFNHGENLRWLPCDHCFHPECIDEWLTGHSSLCPLCKNSVRKEPRGQPLPLTLTDTDTDSDSDIHLLSSSNTSYGAV